ncbi:glycosyltransferase family 4 protein [Helicobacter muridarum]|uniref:Glycosyltransferase n=1 Tax=Helicobacter muridarum TaxID=216 RepID=A0A099TY52_9HELI|nr:glycosyltransferase [Helicobacter muridarum]TLE01646.1 glycosyltransferase family 4 protein [Helicobacter muridarum]STQ86264.1 glycosyltransferase [Helicobacter muridarum]
MRTKDTKIFITLKDITESGGGERVCVNLANALQEIGFDISIISFYHSNTKPIYQLNEDIEIIYLTKGNISKNFVFKAFYKIIYRFYLSLKTCSIIAKAKISIKQKSYSKIRVIANDGLFIPLLKLKDMAVLRIWHMRAPIKERKILRLFDMLIVLSQKELYIWENYHSNIRVIPNFISTNLIQYSNDYELRKSLAQPSNHKKTILSIGSMGRGDIKGFFRLIDIAKILKDICVNKFPRLLHNWEWVIIGNGELKGDYQKKIQQLELEDFVRMEDFRNDIESSYKSSDIYALTSHSEGFSMVLLEASIFGVACISFDIASGPSDIVLHDKSGYLIKDNDLQDFALKTFNLMQDDLLRKCMGNCARQYVVDKFSKEKIMPLWLSALE